MHDLARTVVTGVIVLAAATAATAQSTPPAAGNEPAGATLEQLQQQVERLTAQLQIVKQQLDELKAKQADQQKRAQVERLREAAKAAAEAAPPAAQVETTKRFVSGTRMQPQLNPEISVIGDMFALGGTGENTRASVGEWEVDLQSYLDPYSRFHAVLSKPEGEGLDVEEGYVTWVNLPGRTTLTVGKKRQQFGVLNRWHPHALDQVDLPLVIQESFGEEGLKGTGLSVDWLMPRLWADANELTVEVTNGSNEVAFAGPDWRKPAFLARLKNYWDLNPDSYLEVGLNGLLGKADRNGHLGHDFYALDATYDWYPANRSTYHEVTVRGMLLRSHLDLGLSHALTTWGGYLYGQVKLSPRWTTGVRYDSVDDQREADHRYWGLSPYLTLVQSEFVRLRGQFDYRRDNRDGTDRRFTLQLTVAAGPHKHDTY
jgi:hypothetical protein